MLPAMCSGYFLFSSINKFVAPLISSTLGPIEQSIPWEKYKLLKNIEFHGNIQIFCIFHNSLNFTNVSLDNRECNTYWQLNPSHMFNYTIQFFPTPFNTYDTVMSFLFPVHRNSYTANGFFPKEAHLLLGQKRPIRWP